MSNAEKVIALLEGNNIVKVANRKDMYIVKGKTSTYIAFKGKFCSCEQFIHRCLRKNLICYHLEGINSGKLFPTVNLTEDKIIEILWMTRQNATLIG